MYDCTHPAKKFKQDSTNLYQVRSFVAKHSPHRLTTLNRMVDKMNAAMHRNFLNRPFEIDAGTTYFTMRLKLNIESMERCICFKLIPLRRLFLVYAGTLATLHHMIDTESSQLRGFLWHHSVQCRNGAAKDCTLLAGYTRHTPKRRTTQQPGY